MDVFFVISGYLITGILAREIGAGKFSLGNFWIRRIKRLLPAAMAVVVCTVAAGYFLLLPADWRELLSSAVANSFFSSNVFFWRKIDYFSSSADLKPLLHTWSLAVEEQFYLLLPTALAALLRFLPAARVLALLRLSVPAVIVISLILCCWLNESRQAFAFYLLPTRAWELALGCFVALNPGFMRVPRMAGEALSWAGLGMIIASYFIFDSTTLFPGAATLLPVAGTALIIGANSFEKSSLARMLTWRPLVFIGLISYSLYLWHWPVMAYMRYTSADHPSTGQMTAAVAVSLILAVAGYQWIEKPFRAMKVQNPRNIFLSAGASVALVALAGVAFGRESARRSKNPAEAALIHDAEWTGNQFQGKVKAGGGIEYATLGAPDAPLRAVLWGDSHALVLADTIGKVTESHGVGTIIAARGGVAPVRGMWRSDNTERETRDDLAWNEAVWEMVREKKPRLLMVVACWAAYCGRDGLAGEPQSPKLLKNAKDAPSTVESATRLLGEGLTRLKADCDAIGVRLVVMRQVPEHPHSGLGRINYLAWKFPRLFHRPTAFPSLTDSLLRFKPESEAFAGPERDGMEILNPSAVFFDAQGSFGAFAEAHSLYRDGGHLSYFGAERGLRRLYDNIYSKYTHPGHSVAAD